MLAKEDHPGNQPEDPLLNQPVDEPILWHTPKGRQKRYAGKAVIFEFKPNEFLPAAPIIAGTGIAEVTVATMSAVRDSFWSVINGGSTSDNRLSVVILIKVFVNEVITNLGIGQKMEITPTFIAKLLEKQNVGRATVHQLYGDRLSNVQYVKNHFTKRLNENVWPKDLNVLRNLEDLTPVRRRDEWMAALGGQAIPILHQVYDLNKHGVEHETVFQEYNLFSGYTDAQEESINNLIVGSNINAATEEAAKSGVITMQLLEQLIEFRREWQQNRSTYSAMIEAGTPPTELVLNSNVALARSRGFRNIKMGRME